MNSSKLSEKAKYGYQKFCDGTSMHGFTELYYTKSKFWLLLWFVAIATAIGLTAYQVVKSIDNYMDQATTTSMQLAKPEDMIYPTLQICHPHWIAWVNFTKAFKMGFSKHSVLYGLSYLSNVYSAAVFDVEKVKNSFLASMKHNKLETLEQFYGSIAFDSNDAIEEINNTTLDSTEFRTSEANTKFCLVLNETVIRTILALSNTGKARKSARTNLLSFILDYSKVGPFDDNRVLENSELIKYAQDYVMTEAPNLKTDVLQLPFIAMPMIVYPNKFDPNSIYLSPTFDVYGVTLQLSIQKWKSKPDATCLPGIRHISTNTSCETMCFIDNLLSVVHDDVSDFGTGVLTGKTKPKDITQMKQITFLSDTTVKPNITVTNEEYHWYDNETIIGVLTEKITKCVDECFRTVGCEIYNFDYMLITKIYYDYFNGSRSPNSRIRLIIQYPTESDVLVMLEQDAQTWEGFVGNVGGLLGIWTGASILSFLQLIYLCCFTDSEFGEFVYDCWKSRSITGKNPIFIKSKN